METYQKNKTLDPHPDDARLSVIMDGARIGSVHRCGPRFLGRLSSGRIVANCGSEVSAAQAVMAAHSKITEENNHGLVR